MDQITVHFSTQSYPINGGHGYILHPPPAGCWTWKGGFAMRIFLPCLPYRGCAGICSKDDTNALGLDPCPRILNHGENITSALVRFLAPRFLI